ncbi:LOW QUALITY PROTEIN: hypothetical protein AGABI2DRAFT_138906, partial [Agaricus bisporus var. bisporus H97]|uniref:hypothetical protein n=1 Tax=Agaricus bisporus var. bisporus (strain H97 / ATCC MYA-4626 / FGSC 10389) TaxID=936046 RepID=UPI00029F5444
MSSERNQDSRGSSGQDDYSNNDSYGSIGITTPMAPLTMTTPPVVTGMIRMDRLGTTRTVATTRPLLMDHPTMIHTGV